MGRKSQDLVIFMNGLMLAVQCRKNGNLRRKHRARMKALGLPCALCGRPIHYDEPSDPQHPWSFVIDEKIPVSKWKQYGDESPEAVAQDWNNLQPAHYICNALKSNKVGSEIKKINIMVVEPVRDGEW